MKSYNKLTTLSGVFMKAEDLSEDQLKAYFDEHVRYEIQMLVNAATAIDSGMRVPIGIQHMPIESYAIHLRNLITFFYPSTKRETDVVASDYFFDEHRWTYLRPVLSESLADAKIRADKEVGHLTTARQFGTPASKVWQVVKLKDEIIPIIDLFCEAADKVTLKPSFDELLADASRVGATTRSVLNVSVMRRVD